MFFAWRMTFEASREIGVCWYPCFLAAPGACLLLGIHALRVIPLLLFPAECIRVRRSQTA